jgi:hypothetical protein
LVNNKTLITKSENRQKHTEESELKPQPNKIILKPIEIKDPTRKRMKEQPTMNSVLMGDTPMHKKDFELFSKTSDFNFKILENAENYNEISVIEKKLGLEPGHIVKKINNLKSSFNIREGPDSSYKLKLEEMITLNVIKNINTCGIVKKMLHIPSLRLYTVRVKLT